MFVLLAAAALGASLDAAPEPVDPVVGNWVWPRNGLVTFEADGTVHNQRGYKGTWQYLLNPVVERHYRIIWNHGANVDEFVCAEDGQSGHIHNQAGVQFNVHRATEDQPVASPTPTPETTAAAAGPADLADPVIGEWRWFKGAKVTFKADGTVSSSTGAQGTWEFLHNPEADREYRLDWTHGAYIDHLTYNLAARTGHVVNQKGRRFDVSPGASAPGERSDTTNYFGEPGR